MKITEAFDILKPLCEAHGISGRENEPRELLRSLLSDFPCETDALGNLVFTLREKKNNGKTVALEAHLDKIGLMVSCVTDEGFIRPLKVGGVDVSTLMGSEVLVQKKDGSFVRGLVCAPFPYPAKPHNSARDSEYTMPAADELFIDTALENVRDEILPGAQICMPSHAFRLLGDTVAGSALDDRAGCTALVLAAAFLSHAETDNGIKLIFSSREETGGQGAKTAAFAVAADYSVCVDAGFAISPDVEKKYGSELGKGVEIDISSVLDERFTDSIIEIAKRSDIPYQLSVQPSRATGTDADHLSLAAGGCACALLSIPVRFMHHPSETASLSDIENTARLLCSICTEVE